MSLSTSEKLEILKRGVEEIIPENGLEKYWIQLAHLSHASSIALDAKTLTIFLR